MNRRQILPALLLACVLGGGASALADTGAGVRAKAAAQMAPPFDGTGAQKYQIWVSPAGPVTDINTALARAVPGTDIMVRAGSYFGAVHINKSGTEDAPIRLISADGLRQARIVSDKTGIYGFGTRNVGVFGFHVIAGAKGNGIQFGLSGRDTSDMSRYARNLVIADNLVERAGEDGIKLSQADNVYLLRNVVRDSGVDRNGNGDGGIDLVAVNNSRLIGNFVDGTSGHTCLMMKGGSQGNLVAGNIMKGCERDGISVGGLTTGHWMRPGTDSEAKYNTVVGNDVEAGKAGLLIYGATGNLVANNLCAGRLGCVSQRVSNRGHAPMDNHDNRLENNQVEPGPDIGTAALQGGALARWVQTHKSDVLRSEAR
jgi:hypothetical protein